LLTPKARATPSLREEKQVERNSWPPLQIHWPEAELGNIMHPHPASAPRLTSTIQQHEQHQYSGEVLPERDAFQKNPQTSAFYIEDLHNNIQHI